MYLIQIFKCFFCGPKLDLRQYITYSSHIEQWENRSTCCLLNLSPSGHYQMAREFYSGQLTFMSNLPRASGQKSKVTLLEVSVKSIKCSPKVVTYIIKQIMQTKDFNCLQYTSMNQVATQHVILTF
jgi:hypothetical protein